MSYTKRDFVNQALEEIGIINDGVSLQPELLQSSLRRLDNMMATWNADNITLGYPIPSSPGNSDLDEVTNVPDSANEAICKNLALKIAPIFGKNASIDTRVDAERAYSSLLSEVSQPIEMRVTNIPKGAGYKDTDFNPIIEQEIPPLDVGEDGNLTFN